MPKNCLFWKIAVAAGYVAMVTVNYLANALPIGGVTTGQASDAYANLFTPAGYAFSIWGLIYLLLLGYTVHQFGFGQKVADPEREKSFSQINRYFLLSSFANIAWIFAWHHGIIWLSVLIMLTLLVSLIFIAGLINKKTYSLRDTVLIRLPFSIYFGWITVATIANVTVWLVSMDWNGFGISEAVWTMVILLVGAGIGILRTLKDRNVYYAAVLVWAFGAILFKHYSSAGFDGRYPGVIAVIIICLAGFAATIGYLWKKNRAAAEPVIKTA